MLAKLRSYRPSHTAVVAYLALFVALGGSSYAAVTLKRGSVKGAHIARNAVTSPKVKDRSLLARDFAPGQLPPGEVGAQGPPGDPGQQGQTGQDGQTGAPGSALAFAYIDSTKPDGDLVDDSRSKNVSDANVTRPLSGTYCFDSLPFSFKNVVASSSLAFTSVAVQGVVGDANTCPGDEALQLHIQNNSGTPTSADVWVLFN